MTINHLAQGQSRIQQFVAYTVVMEHETLPGGAANKHDKHVCLNIAEAPLSSTAHTT